MARKSEKWRKGDEGMASIPSLFDNWAAANNVPLGKGGPGEALLFCAHLREEHPYTYSAIDACYGVKTDDVIADKLADNKRIRFSMP
jgi:hypothetical protein